MATTTPYNSEDSYVLLYSDGEYSLERNDKADSLKASDITHIVLEGETLQNIAYRYYGDSGRWGDIAAINKLVDPFEEVTKGTHLIIPL